MRGCLAGERDRHPVGRSGGHAACRCPPGRCPSGTSRPERRPARSPTRRSASGRATARRPGRPGMPPRASSRRAAASGGTAATGDDQRGEDGQRGPSGWPSKVRHRLMLPSDHDEDRLRGDARAVPSDRPPRLVRSRRKRPASRPGSWSASTSTRGPRSRARAPSRGRSWARSGQRTSLPFGTAVTCPGFRYHPAVIAHAAATLGAMYPGRFWLGLGAGEALNEHVVGGDWPEIGIRSVDDVRGDRDHQQALHRQGRQAQGRPLHAREREALHAPRRAGPDLRGDGRARSTPRRPASSPTG